MAAAVAVHARPQGATEASPAEGAEPQPSRAVDPASQTQPASAEAASAKEVAAAAVQAAQQATQQGEDPTKNLNKVVEEIKPAAEEKLAEETSGNDAEAEKKVELAALLSAVLTVTEPDSTKAEKIVEKAVEQVSSESAPARNETGSAGGENGPSSDKAAGDALSKRQDRTTAVSGYCSNEYCSLTVLRITTFVSEDISYSIIAADAQLFMLGKQFEVEESVFQDYANNFGSSQLQGLSSLSQLVSLALDFFTNMNPSSLPKGFSDAIRNLGGGPPGNSQGREQGGPLSSGPSNRPQGGSPGSVPQSQRGSGLQETQQGNQDHSEGKARGGPLSSSPPSREQGGSPGSVPQSQGGSRLQETQQENQEHSQEVEQNKGERIEAEEKPDSGYQKCFDQLSEDPQKQQCARALFHLLKSKEKLTRQCNGETGSLRGKSQTVPKNMFAETLFPSGISCGLKDTATKYSLDASTYRPICEKCFPAEKEPEEDQEPWWES
ncbi:hypothetical protein CDD83_3460 [Cordyceps sp. RAO-2017]|nr:hypothetical protein CDD83_3460 [Cordyceps sp. RAO-2017]